MQIETTDDKQTLIENLSVEVALSPFRAAIGSGFDKVVNDVKAMLGRAAKDIISKDGGWKASAKFALTSKTGHKLQLAPNDASTILLCFGMRLVELGNAGSFTIQAEVPKECGAWVQKHAAEVKK